MITQIEVDGFKSLANFKMVLNPGLNVLVGPNGTGKTNIVSFFEYLAHVIETDPVEATSFLGGAGSILRRINKDHQPIVTVRVVGCYPAQQHARIQIEDKTLQGQFVIYDYDFTLHYLGALDPVIFAHQHLKCRHVNHFTPAADLDETTGNWEVDIEANLDAQQMKPIFKVKSCKGRFADYMPFGKKPAEITKQVEHMLDHFASSNSSLPNLLSRINPFVLGLSSDIACGQAYNIIPSRVRMSEDSARPPGISSDGSGLSTTLYSLKRRTPQTSNYTLWHAFTPGRQTSLKTPSLETLTKYFQLANQSIAGINIDVHQFNNQVQVSFDVKNGAYTASIPLSLMSDGTLKWITLLTAALTASSVFSIEEPENYLHPNMQAQCVNLLRDILFQENKHSCIVMTTHSETVLNNCQPSELVIVNLTDGKTVAYRCKNESEISDEIAKTGFGLGYYYINNALHND